MGHGAIAFKHIVCGKGEKYRNRKRTVFQKTVEIRKICGTYAIVLLQQKDKNFLLDTRRGTDLKWPRSLQEAVRKSVKVMPVLVLMVISSTSYIWYISLI